MSENLQSTKPAPSSSALAAVHEALALHGRTPEYLLPVLHAVQAKLRCVPLEALAPIAAALDLSEAEVYGVVTFYKDFRTKPPGQHLLRLCCAEACQAMGSRALETRLTSQHQVPLGATSSDEAITAERVYCLGNCALAPSLSIDGDLHGRITSQRLDELVSALRRSP